MLDDTLTFSVLKNKYISISLVKSLEITLVKNLPKLFVKGYIASPEAVLGIRTVASSGFPSLVEV